jgi:hypothetical protein
LLFSVSHLAGAPWCDGAGRRVALLSGLLMTDYQPEPTSPYELGCLGVIGALVLLPGLCVVFVTVDEKRVSPDTPILWAVGFFLGAFGVYLLTISIQALRR